MKMSDQLSAISLVLLLPATALIISSVVGFNVPPALIHPVLVMGGLTVALGVNLGAVLKVNAEREGNHLAALTIRIGAKPLNLAVVGISALCCLRCSVTRSLRTSVRAKSQC
jgi:hypothetical protein